MSEEAPESLGGTRSSMSPEHLAAFRAIQQGRPLEHPVDARAVLYYQAERFPQAEADLEQALRHGAEPAAVCATRPPGNGIWSRP